jgi:hypothetical protein
MLVSRVVPESTDKPRKQTKPSSTPSGGTTQKVPRAATTKPNQSTSGAKDKATNDGGREMPTVHVDLQIHISPDATTEQIDAIFASMSKHLYGR